METSLSLLSEQLGMSIWLFAFISVWSLAWKAVALWKSARNNHLAWFVIMAVLNTVGILPILYIFVFSKMKPKIKDKPKAIPKRTSTRKKK